MRPADAYPSGMVERERNVERRLVDLVRRRGGLCLKWTSPGTVGVPDRIVVMPGGRIYLVELKRPGGKPRPSQVAFHAKLARRGVRVHVVDDADAFACDVLDSGEQGVHPVEPVGDGESQ